MLSVEQIKKFQQLYKKHFKEEIGKEKAYESASKLLRLVEIVYKAMTRKEYRMLQKRRTENKSDAS